MIASHSLSSVLTAASVPHLVVAGTRSTDELKSVLDWLSVVSHNTTWTSFTGPEWAAVIDFYVQSGMSEADAKKRAMRLGNKLVKSPVDVYYWLEPDSVDRKALLLLMSRMDDTPRDHNYIDMSKGK